MTAHGLLRLEELNTKGGGVSLDQFKPRGRGGVQNPLHPSPSPFPLSKSSSLPTVQPPALPRRGHGTFEKRKITISTAAKL